MVKNIVMLIVLVCALVTGYFIGDYRGREARRALEEAARMGQDIDRELREANASLNSDLNGVNARHAQEMQKLHEEYASQSAEWHGVKQGLTGTIRQQNAQLAEHNRMLDELLARLGRADGAEKVAMEQKVAMLRQDIDTLLRELNGNTCLRTPVPQAVIDTLNGPRQLGSK